MKMRSDCVLSKLTQQQLDEIFDSIAFGVSYRDLQMRLEKPPPEGFGLRIQLATLCRFFKAERRRRHAEELAEARFHELTDDDPEQLLQNVKVELAHACYDIANRPDNDSVSALSRMAHRLDLIRLEQQRLALEREFLAEKKRQFNFDAAKQAAIHALAIQNVLRDNTIDTEAKVWKVSDIVFGPPPAQNNQ
jgi:hypothetical protein